MKSYNQSFGDPHSKLVILGCFFVECGASKIAFLSRRELSSLRLFGTAVVTPESNLHVHQNPWRLANESSIKRFNGAPIVNFPARIQNFVSENRGASRLSGGEVQPILAVKSIIVQLH